MILIKEYPDGTKIEQGPGRFDDYCVYVTESNGIKKAPRDRDYFNFFTEMSKKYTNTKIYQDFVKIYNKTNSEIEKEVLEEIDVISSSYEEDEREFNIWYTVIYLGMVAEELKANAILKKKVKRLGMYQILMEGMKADDAASFSKSKKAAELISYCKARGF